MARSERILVVGGSGFVGRALLPLLSARGVPVTATYKSAADFPEFCQQHAPGVIAVRTDLGSGGEAVLAGRWDTCVYLAAHVRLAETARTLEADLSKNVIPLVRLLERVEAERFVYVSSGSVYEGAIGPVSPRTPPAPTLPYSISKVTCEAAVRFAKLRRGSVGSYSLLRFFGAFGPWEAPFKIYTRAIEASVSGQVLQGYGDGSNLIDAMPVRSTAEALMSVVDAGPLPDEVLDLSMGKPQTIRECVAEIGSVLGREVRMSFSGESPEDIRYSASPLEFMERFGWSGPPQSRAEGILELAAWLEDRRSP